MVLCAPTLSAQGFVREGAPRPSARTEETRCETWRGDIHGNDPSASIVVELCTEGTKVTGTFSWSSRESGRDRRALVGEWRNDGTLLVARDTAMLEAHPLNGWTLCTADAYTLRRISAERLEGYYHSERCHDRGNLAMTRLGAEPRPLAAKISLASPPARAAHVQIPLAIVPGAHSARCSASPGMSHESASAHWFALVAIFCVTRARRRQPSARDASA
jgi:hypothetical protein